MKDYYKILGLTSTCTSTEIRKAYRIKALKLHPDVNNSATAKADFIELNEAYGVLKNPSTRVRYDNIQFHQAPRNRPVTKKTQRRSSHVYKSAERGKRKGENLASEGSIEVKNHGFFTSIFGEVFVNLVLEGVLFILRLFI